MPRKQRNSNLQVTGAAPGFPDLSGAAWVLLFPSVLFFAAVLLAGPELTMPFQILCLLICAAGITFAFCALLQRASHTSRAVFALAVHSMVPAVFALRAYTEDSLPGFVLVFGAFSLLSWGIALLVRSEAKIKNMVHEASLQLDLKGNHPDGWWDRLNNRVTYAGTVDGVQVVLNFGYLPWVAFIQAPLHSDLPFVIRGVPGQTRGLSWEKVESRYLETSTPQTAAAILSPPGVRQGILQLLGDSGSIQIGPHSIQMQLHLGYEKNRTQILLDSVRHAVSLARELIDQK